MKEAVMKVVGDHFRSEFINRIDEVVMFHPLGQKKIRCIATIQLLMLRDRLAEPELRLRILGAALDNLTEADFDPVYGARPLRHAIQQKWETHSRRKVLAGVMCRATALAPVYPEAS